MYFRPSLSTFSLLALVHHNVNKTQLQIRLHFYVFISVQSASQRNHKGQSHDFRVQWNLALAPHAYLKSSVAHKVALMRWQMRNNVSVEHNAVRVGNKGVVSICKGIVTNTRSSECVHESLIGVRLEIGVGAEQQRCHRRHRTAERVT